MAGNIQNQNLDPLPTSIAPAIPSWMQGMDPNSAEFVKLFDFLQTLPPGVDTSDMSTVLNQYNMISGENITINDVNINKEPIETTREGRTQDRDGTRTTPGGEDDRRLQPGEEPVPRADYGDPFQYEDWMVGAMNPYLLPLFGQQPQYEIPQSVYDLIAEYDQSAADILRTAQETQTGALADIRTGSEQALGTLRGARDESLGYAKGEIGRIRDITKRGGKAALDELYASRKESLATLEKGGDTALDLMKLQAFGGLPGEALTREAMEASTQGMLSDIRERAGGSSSALGAIAGGYGQQMGLQRDLGAQRAQYQAQGISNLAQGQLDVSGRYAEAQYGAGQDIAEMKRTAANDLSAAIADTTKYYTDLQSGYARDIAGTELQTGVNMGEMRLQTGANIGQAQYLGAELKGAGLSTLIGQEQQEWMFNMYQPYQNQLNYFIEERGRIDPSSYMYDYNTGQISQSWAEKTAAQMGISTAEVMRRYGGG